MAELWWQRHQGSVLCRYAICRCSNRNRVLLTVEQVNVGPVADSRILAQMDGRDGQALSDLVFFWADMAKGKVHAVGQDHGNVHQIDKLSPTRLWIVNRRMILFASGGNLLQKVWRISTDTEL